MSIAVILLLPVVGGAVLPALRSPLGAGGDFGFLSDRSGFHGATRMPDYDWRRRRRRAQVRRVKMDRRRWLERAGAAPDRVGRDDRRDLFIGYMARAALGPAKLRLYYVNYNLFLFSMLAIPLMAEPTLVWIVVELTTLCSALLVSFDNTHAALEAAWKYVMLSLMGAGMALFGFLVLFAAMQSAGGGTYTWAGLLAVAPRMPPGLLQAAFALILIGLGTKVGLVPMHTWLPDAHSQAPSPVCALLSGVETTAILYVILRLFPLMRAVPGAHAETWALALGLISVGTAAFLLLQVRDYKRMFAFSTVEHMGIILTAIGLGASATGYGAMQQVVGHALTKSFCFFAAGAALLVVETREIAAVRGLIRISPTAGAALVLGGLGIAGAPPLALFLSEFSIIKGGLAHGHPVAIGWPCSLAGVFRGDAACQSHGLRRAGRGGARFRPCGPCQSASAIAALELSVKPGARRRTGSGARRLYAEVAPRPTDLGGRGPDPDRGR